MKENWRIHHLGFIVKDIDQTIDYYRSLGIATIGNELPTMQNADKEPTLRVRFIQIGSVYIEFFQPVATGTRQHDFLTKHGEGIQHIAFAVDDIDKEVDELVSAGGKLLLRGGAPDRTRIAYFDTGKIGDFLVELMQLAEGYDPLTGKF